MQNRMELLKELRKKNRMVTTRDDKIKRLQNDIKTNAKKLKATLKELKASNKHASQKQKELESIINEKQEVIDLFGKKLESHQLHNESISRHQYSEFVVSTATELCVSCGCSLRQVPQILELFCRKLNLELPKIPCHNSVKNWAEKVGYSIYTDPREKASLVREGDGYAIIVDESMKVGGQKNLLMLGVKSDKLGEEALTASDVTVLSMEVKSSWNSQLVGEKLSAVSREMGQNPDYIISDNASTLSKAIRENEQVPIRDVGHTVALCVQNVYEKDEEFVSLMKDISVVKSQEVMRPTAVLLPPKQRTISRFMNLFCTIRWAFAMLVAFGKFNDEEKRVYGFLCGYRTLINELYVVGNVINSILKCLKDRGLSRDTASECLEKISRLLHSRVCRVRAVGVKLRDYINEEAGKLPENLSGLQVVWNCSSDIIESLFGWDKRRASPNKMNGITTRVLMLPLLTRVKPRAGNEAINYKECLEKVTMNMLRTWKNTHLLENKTIKRKKLLAIKNTNLNPV